MSSNNSTDNNKRKKWKASALIGGGLLVSSLILSIVLVEIGTWKADWIGISADQEKTTIQEHSPPTVDGAVTKYTVTTKDVPAKTLWDWLSVLGIPLSLALLGFLFQHLSDNQAKLEKERAAEQAEIEKEIAESYQKEEVLQAYFDRLATLLIDKNLIAIANKFEEFGDTSKEEEDLISESKGVVRDVIRARTLSILRRLGADGERKASVMQFLIEARVVSTLNLDLSGANLSHANLSSANLSDANLNSSDFRSADLSNANLSDANLNGSDFRSADLSNAYLSKAKLGSANLSGANLSGANLSSATLMNVKLNNADLSGANLNSAYLVNANLNSTNLSGANLEIADLLSANISDANLSNANLRGADFSNSQNLTLEQVTKAKLCQTVLPSNIQIDPDRDCEELGIKLS